MNLKHVVLVALPILLMTIGSELAAQQDARTLRALAPFGPQLIGKAGPQCSGGAAVDDGSMENGYRIPFASDARFVQRLTPTTYPSLVSRLCVCWENSDPASMGFNFLVYADDGPSGQPGTLLGTKVGAVSSSLSFKTQWIGVACTDLDAEVESGGVLVGVSWNAAANFHFFVCADESHGTPQATMFESANAGGTWTPVVFDQSGARALGLRAEFTPIAPPQNPDPPNVPGLTSPSLPGFLFWVRISNTRIGTAADTPCPDETVCVAGAIPTRAEILVRIVGPKPNGYLWPNIVKFNTTKTEVWIRQVSTGATKYYSLPALAPDSDTLPGLVDKTGFLP